MDRWEEAYNIQYQEIENLKPDTHENDDVILNKNSTDYFRKILKNIHTKN